MAAPRKRILRKDIRQPDRFMVLTGQMLEWFKAYRTQLIGVGATVVAVAVVVAGWQYYRGYQRDLAFQEYNKALGEYREGSYEAALESFRNLKGRGEAPYDAIANLYIANSYIALDQPANAVETLGSGAAAGQDGFLDQVALVTLGLAQEMNGSCEEAVTTLSRALEHKGPMREEAMLGKARCNTTLGKTQEAVDGYKAYLEEFPEGETIEIALEAKTGKSPEQTTQ